MVWFEFSVGVLIVFWTWGSLIATFVLPRGESLFQGSSALVLRAVRLAGVQAIRLFPRYSTKDALLGAIGPIALLVQLAAFLVAFVVGIALELMPWVSSFPNALNQAAGSLFVVGLAGDSGQTNNVLRVLAAATGAVTIALQIGYLPLIYQAFARREALVALMESRAGVPAWGPEVLMRHILIDSLDSLPSFYRDWELWSADLAESHGTLPVLLLFRSAEAGYSWLLSLLAVLDSAALQLALCPTTAPTGSRMCLRMGFRSLQRIATTLHWNYDHDPSPDGPIELSFPEFESAVLQLVETGLVIERPAAEAWRHFVGWRVNYEAIAYRLADHLVAPHAPWSGTRQHLPPEITLPRRPPHRSPDGEKRPDNWLRPR